MSTDQGHELSFRCSAARNSEWEEVAASAALGHRIDGICELVESPVGLDESLGLLGNLQPADGHASET